MNKEPLPIFSSSKFSHWIKVAMDSWDALGLMLFNNKKNKFSNVI
jgi:hypothetical protein